MAELQGFMYPRTPTGAAGILPGPPWHYSGEMLTVEFRTDPANVAELIVGKQRNGPTGLVKLAFAKQYTRFESLDWQHGDA